MSKMFFFVIAAISAVAFGAIPRGHASNTHTVVAAADSAGGGVGELSSLLKLLRNPRNVTESLAPWCQEAFAGDLGNRSVLLLYTGIGYKDAAVCMQAMLTRFSSIRELIYIGTAGFSPQTGGVLNPPHCGAARQVTTPVPLGSLCIGASGTIWDAHEEPWLSPMHLTGDSCTDLGDANHSTRMTYKLAGATTVGPLDYADHVVHVLSQAGPLPKPETLALTGAVEYWSAMSAGSGVNYSATATPSYLATPQIFHGRHAGCLENGGYSFWRGAPYEAQCRMYTATPLNASVDDVLCVSAMEGPGWIDIVERFNRRAAAGNQVRYVNIRANSDYVHWPVAAEQPPRLNAWREMDPQEWLSGEYRPWVLSGFRSAISAASFAAAAIVTQGQMVA
eukprot:TRINITY_DN5862_c0_g1_i1.p1 TRINITY_DN5862_c0_g1~~TRINITY_DN5862_c0_g1_i1.p1  ORF type:complete len:461 (+),score=61.87 TRINITY_DN5862_c0_g1_i1:208-1383(+)